MKSKQSKKPAVLESNTQELLRKRIGFEWPLNEGHSSFCAETKHSDPYGEAVWERGIRIGIFQEPTVEDINSWKFTSERYKAKVEVYKFLVNKRGIRTGKSMLCREILFNGNDPDAPFDLIRILVEQVNTNSGWKRIA
jgi:hypothetical protein